MSNTTRQDWHYVKTISKYKKVLQSLKFCQK
nr:MAG TPA: hypothetical protein [Caudoviricetes sp.]